MSRRFFFLIPLLLFISSKASAQNPGDLFFIQLADPQFGASASNNDFMQETANYEFAVANINRLHPKFVVICGDLINKTGDPVQTAEYLRITSKIDRSIPVYAAPGNHDVGDEPTPDTLAYYREHFGKDYYGFREGDIYGIVLNSSLISAPAKAQSAAEQQEAWLKDELQKANASGARHIVIFQHHSWFLESPDEPTQYFNIPLEQRKHYLDLLKSSGVHYVFAGHYHRNAYGRDGDLEMITNASVSRPLGIDPTGIRLVTVHGETLDHRYYAFGEIPNRYPAK
jgi:3',5'-cyclic AMP phosphodiesterase CpdA